MQSHELVKLYYRIGEVSEIVGVQPHVLRYWETEFRSIRPAEVEQGPAHLLAARRREAAARQGLAQQPGLHHRWRAQAAERSRAWPSRRASAVLEEPSAEPSAKDMRKVLLGLRQELVRMLDEISALKRR